MCFHRFRTLPSPPSPPSFGGTILYLSVSKSPSIGGFSDYLENNNTFTATDWVSLFERLYAFYLRWSQGEFIEALESSSNILPLNKAAQLQQYQIPLGQRQADIYTGLNILSLLLLINTHAQSQADLNKKIHFYPCGNPDNAEELDRLRLLKIIGYSECLGAFTFCRKLGDFLSNVNLSNADLRYANLSNADLRYADLRYANLSNADLSNAYLINSDLSNADLSNAYLSNAYLSFANLSNAYLSNAYLSNTYLSNAYLINSDLSEADLSFATLINVNLSNADLSNTDLAVIRWDQETNWQGVRGLDTARNVPEALKQQLGLIDNG
jgi:uncharacterized protein YjbI with pentapeptide repeats